MRLKTWIAGVFLVVLGVVAVLPAAAAGSVVIGSDLANAPDANGTCGATGCSIAEIISPSPLKSPTNGLVTSWATLGGSATLGTHGTLRLQILREAGSGAYTAVRSGPLTTVPTSTGHPLITIPVSPGLPINQGDLVGMEVGGGGTALAQRAKSGFAYAFWSSPLTDGETRTPDVAGLLREMLYQATIEPTDTFTLGGVTRNKKKGTATIDLTVPNAGDLTASGQGATVAGAVTSKSVGAGATQLVVKAAGKKRKKLKRTGKVKLNLAITYTPTGGAANTESTTLKLRKKL